MVPAWLHGLSWGFLALGALCALVIAADELKRPQHMWIMNVVWPITALFGTIWIVWQYFTYGRSPARAEAHAHSETKKKRLPFPIAVANATLHCGAGCTLGDILAEWLVYAFPVIAIAFGWGSLFDERIFAVWVVDYLFAYAFGIVFQYFTIAPMRGLSFKDGIVAAVKADTFSLTAWQIGMYGFMAVAYFLFFRSVLGVKLEASMAEFWFMMQIAMLCGFCTSYPVNWWLLRRGIKEPM